MLGISLEHQYKNVNTKISNSANSFGIPKDMRKEFKEYNYTVETDKQGNNLVNKSVAPLNQKKLENLTVARILKSLHKNNPDGLLSDESLLSDAEKIAKCGTRSYVEINGEQVPVVYNQCGKRHCPYCTWKKSTSFSTEMAQVIDLAFCKKVDVLKDTSIKAKDKKDAAKRVRGNYYTGEHKPRMGFVTLTVPNCEMEDLSRTITHMVEAWDKIQCSYEFKRDIDGGMKALEVTVNLDTMTFHPHFHILLSGKQRKNLKKWFTMSGKASNSKNNYVAEKAWRERWQEALYSVGHEVDISYKSINVQYITKNLDFTNEEERNVFCATQARELGKYVWKYTDMIALAKPTYQNIKYDTGLYYDGSRFKDARGVFGKEKSEDIKAEDWQKLKTAFWYTMRGLYHRQTHVYFGSFAKIRKQLKEERAELADSGSMVQNNKQDCRTRPVEFTGDILVDKQGNQVWDKSKAISRLKIEKQDKPIYAIKYFKAKPNENGEREPFYQVISPEFDATRFEILNKNCPGRNEKILHNIHYATLSHINKITTLAL